MTERNFDFIVLGGGVAGLAAAYRLCKAGKSVLVLEKDKRIGGLAKTLNINGFLFDYCAHRFHSANPIVMQEMRDLMGPNFLQHRQKSRIYLFNKYLKYPFEMQNLLRAMPKLEAARCAFDFAWNTLIRCFKKREIRSYADWFEHFFGKRFYKFMCYPYTRKIWGMDPARLSADWANQRFKGPDISKLIRTIVKKILTLNFSSFSLEDEEFLPDSGIFYYPIRGGIQAMPDRFAEEVQKHGGVIHTGVNVCSINAKTRTVSFEQGGMTQCETANHGLISTIPLHAYAALLDEALPAQVTENLRHLRYMDIIFVFLFVDKEHISNDTWLYFPDKDVAFNRAVEFKNWSSDMAPSGKTSLCLDITVTPENKHFWGMSEKDLAERCTRDCEALGLCATKDVFDVKVVRIHHAYPVYDLEYRPKLDSILQFIESFNGVYCIGRTGVFRYNNSDNSIEMGLELGKRLADQFDSDKSMRSYEFSGVSY